MLFSKHQRLHCIHLILPEKPNLPGTCVQTLCQSKKDIQYLLLVKIINTCGANIIPFVSLFYYG